MIPCGVSVIPDSAFAYCTNLASVTISDGVTKVGSEAFVNLGPGYGIVIPSDVTMIVEDAFDGSDITIIAPEGSYPAQWAADHHLEWMAP